MTQLSSKNDHPKLGQKATSIKLGHVVAQVPPENPGRFQHLDVSKNRGKTPKMDGLYNGNPY